MNSEPIPYIERLRTELVNGVAREPARRKRRQRFAASALAAVTAVLVLGIATVDVSDRSTALAVSRDDRWITVEIADATADPRRMTQELRDAGINGEVKVRPVSPSLVGRWAALEARPATPLPGPEAIVSITELVDEPPGAAAPPSSGAERRLSAVDFHPDRLRIPVDFEDRLVLTAGRAPRGEELYAESASAFAPGEPLHCTGIERLSPARAETAVAAKGYRVHTVVETPPPRSGKPVQRRTRPRVVIGAQLLSTRPTARGVGPPRGRNEIVLYVSSSSSARTPYGIPPQHCGP
jgi:hypothetical protein